MIASAPGKILLAGEYAILDGAEAVVMAVTRRARAHVVDAPVPLSPFLAAARDVLVERFGAGSGPALAAARVVVDTSALQSDGRKLGLGSSAAATVAAIGCALVAGGEAPEPALLHRLAHTAHGTAQAPRGSRGSGADVAASVHGGLLAVRPTGEGEPLAVRRLTLPPDLHLVAVWTETPADTPSLVARVRALRADHAARYDACSRAIAEASAALIAALEASDATAAVTALRAGGAALAALGEASGASLDTPTHAALRVRAESLGGALKATGAGGGDMALAAFTDKEAASRFGDRIYLYNPIDLNGFLTVVR